MRNGRHTVDLPGKPRQFFRTITYTVGAGLKTEELLRNVGIAEPNGSRG